MKFRDIENENNGIEVLTAGFELIDFADEKRLVEIDLGCGKGGFASALASKYQDRLVIAADVMLGRLRKLSRRCRNMKQENMRIMRVNAYNLVAYMLPDASIHRLHILCPDPWPKSRHAGHRLLNSEFIGRVHRILAPDGIFHIATDDQKYFDSAFNVIENSSLFKNDDSLIHDISDIKTDFEKIWEKDGRTVAHSSWIKH